MVLGKTKNLPHDLIQTRLYKEFFHIPHMHHHKPLLVHFFTPFFTVAYIVERLVLQTIYVIKKGNSSIFGPKICGLKLRAISNQKRYNGALTVD